MLDGPALIIVLFLAGFFLVAAEVFVPGLIVGSVGFLCLAASVALVFYHYGMTAGFLAALLVGGACVAGLIIWLNIFPRTFIGRRIILQRQQPPGASGAAGLVGETGVALTALRPAGAARLAGKRVDVTAVGEFLEEGAPVVVVAADGLRVAVRRKDKLETAAAAG